MLFNSPIFLFVFLPVTYLVFWGLRTAQTRYVWLAVTGYVFYGYWNPRFCLLMAFSTAVSYLAGLGFLKYTDPKARRLLLVVPIAVDLSLLGFFKYANFAERSLVSVLHILGVDVHLPHLNIILPVGISFYTFHTITYIVDAYRGTIRPTRNLFEFAAYVSLFSQLVAGPIVRFRQIEADLESLGAASRTRWLRLGISFFIVGLVEKVIVADSLAAFVDPALKSYHGLGTIGAWLAVLGYTFQLYFDFSGYSTMAVGLGFMFGLRLPQNFNSPYKALNPSDFWQRWHISLSSVLRDYLYIPLGGSRGGTWFTYRNLLITMLLGGLWHGAGWTFVVWGAYHGCLLIGYRMTQGWWDARSEVLQRVMTFLLVVVGWVFFRSESFGMAAQLLRKMVAWQPGTNVPAVSLALFAILVASVWSMGGKNPFEFKYTWNVKQTALLAAGAGAALALILGNRVSPFLYFQF
jgi:alginate O-acetyltransferase complex protein AlgI